MANSTVPQTSIEGKKTKPFGLSDKFGYMFGDFANCLLFIGMSMFLQGWYQDVLGLNPLTVGTMMMIIKFLDAFTDIGMGRIVDKFKGTKAGKFKPWILWLAGPTALASFMMYQSYMAGADLWVKWTYAVITYILFNSIFYTGINIPYSSMASAMVTSPQERAQLSAWRGIGPMLASASLAGVMLIPNFLYSDKNKTLAGPMIIVAGVASIVSFSIYLACYFMCTERVDLNRSKNQNISLLKSLKNVFTSKAFIILAIVTIIQVVAQLAVSAINRYLYGVVFFGTAGFTPAQAGMFSGLYTIFGSIITIAVVTPLTLMSVRKIGKKMVAVYSTIGGAVAYFLVYAFGSALRKNVWGYLFASLVPFAITGALTAITFAFITDIVDDMEVKNGMREDAPVYGMYSFIRKLAQGIATQLGGVILTATNYDPKLGVSEGSPNLAAAVPMYNVLNLGYAIGFVVIGLLFWFLYPLGKKKVAENAQILRERRAALEAQKMQTPVAEVLSTDIAIPEEAASFEGAELIINDERLENVDSKNMENTPDVNDLRQQLRDYDNTHLDNKDDNNKE